MLHYCKKLFVCLFSNCAFENEQCSLNYCNYSLSVPVSNHFILVRVMVNSEPSVKWNNSSSFVLHFFVLAISESPCKVVLIGEKVFLEL